MVNYSSILAGQLGIPLWTLVLIIIWSLIWKLLALWKSAKKNSVIWFIVLGILNTLGILEILYLFVFSEINSKKNTKKKSKKN